MMSQMFCNILEEREVQFGSFRCFRRGHEDDKTNETARCRNHLIFSEFASMVSSLTLKSMVLGQPNLAWLARFLQPERNSFDHLVTVLISSAP